MIMIVVMLMRVLVIVMIKMMIVVMIMVMTVVMGMSYDDANYNDDNYSDDNNDSYDVTDSYDDVNDSCDDNYCSDYDVSNDNGRVLITPVNNPSVSFSFRMQQFGATGIPATRRDADTRSPLDDDDEEDLINPGSPNTFEDDISEDEVSLDARSPAAPTTSSSHSTTSPSEVHGSVGSVGGLPHPPLSLDSKPPTSPRPPILTSPSKDPTKEQERGGGSPSLKDDHESSKSLLPETPSIPTSLQALAPALTIASLVSSHKRPASPSDHYVTPIRPIPERHVFGYSSMQPMTKRPFTLSPMGPITDRHFLSSAGAFQPIRLQPKQKEET